MGKTFNLSLNIDVTLSVDELWPDGDAPENPTVADVENLIADSGGWSRILDDWNLMDPHHGGEVSDNSEIEARMAALRSATSEPRDDQ
jgi:hypothetical protein